MSSKTFDTEYIQKFATVDLYKYLALNKDSFTPSKARSQFKKFILKYHPDKNRDDPKATDKFMLIEASYKILADPVTRTYYNKIHDETKEDLDEDYTELRSIDRSKLVAKVQPTKKEYELMMKEKNLALDSTYYDNANSGKLTDIETANLIKERNNNLLDEDLKQKFQSDMNILNKIDDKKDRQQKFNEMFDMGVKGPAQSQSIQAYSSGKRLGMNTELASVDQTETMFSDVNDFDESFELLHHELSDDEEYNENNFADYETNYLAGLQDDGSLSKLALESKLTNGRGDYTFDDNS